MTPRHLHGHALRVPASSKFALVFPLLCALACTQGKTLEAARPALTASPVAASAAYPQPAATAPPQQEAPALGAPDAPKADKKSASAARPRALRAQEANKTKAGVLAPAGPLTDEAPDTAGESYAALAENPFLAVKQHPLSTFSSDVDTASYSNARRFLRDGQLPPRESVRVEEWINYFSYDYAPPEGNAPVAVRTEVSDCPWRPEHRLVRIGLKTRPVEQAAVPARNLVFLLDVSGSMNDPNKLPLLKTGLGMLARTLRPQDRVAIVVYAGASGLVLPSTPGNRQDEILGALEALSAGGSTNGADGIRLAYAVAKEHFVPGGINRVVLATDGDFNVGTTSQSELESLITEKRKTGVFLTVLGFGDGNLKDSTMELLADKGNGNYAYIDSAVEARKVLVREAGATLVTVAKDVKLQVEFNPARVASYRLVGYENRTLANRDFNDDRKDAGDMGAGHAVTALYELVPTAASERSDQNLLSVSVRYKQPAEEQSSKLVEAVLDRPVPFAAASTDHRFAAAVAEFAQVMRGSTAAGKASLDSARSIAQGALGSDPGNTRRELLAMIGVAKSLSAH